MVVSDNIARLIENMLDEGGGVAELKRNDLALRVGCVPSQINYVISSRFTPERGYIIESRRGGGGFIKILRVKMDRNEYLMHFFHAIGNSLDEQECKAYLINLRDNEIVSDREAKIIASAATGSVFDSIPPIYRNKIRADIIRHVILSLIG